jgi:predicted nucleic acid-binding protein
MPDSLHVLVDTHVLIHSDDASDPFRHRRAREWLNVLWQRRCGRVTTQVLAEYYAVVSRRLSPPVPAGDARAEVRRYQHWKPWQTDHQTVETAWAVESRFGLSWWHALVVAAALHQGCRYLLTDELPHGLQIDGVRILDPFVVGPEILDEPTP